MKSISLRTVTMYVLMLSFSGMAFDYEYGTMPQIASYIVFVGVFTYYFRLVNLVYLSLAGVLVVFLTLFHHRPIFIFIVFPVIILAVLNPRNVDAKSKRTTTPLIWTLIFFIWYYLIRTNFEIGGVREQGVAEPNFLAGYFSPLIFLVDSKNWRIRIISIILLCTIFLMTLSRTLLAGIAIIVVCFWILKKWETLQKVAAIGLILTSAIWPILDSSLAILGQETASDYITGVDRIYQLNDASNAGRTVQIMSAVDDVYSNGIFSYSISDDIMKPHNWFWLLSRSFGFIDAFFFLVLLVICATRVSPHLSVQIATVSIMAGFLDYLPLIFCLYYILISSMTQSELSLN